MTAPATRMKAMRRRRRDDSKREIRIAAPDARSVVVRKRVAEAVARLSASHETTAMDWIEAVSEFDEIKAPGAR